MTLSYYTEFRGRFYADVALNDWQDYSWQIKNSIQNQDDINRYLNIDFDFQANLPFKITPYLAALIYENKSIAKQFIPSNFEMLEQGGEIDPLAEEKSRVNDILIHKYPDRVLLLLSNVCAAYCRYCTRSRIIGQNKNINEQNFEEAVKYIRENSQIRDVLISGGDPLMLSDDFLDNALSKIRDVPHVEIIRIGTRVISTLPFRITDKLISILKKYQPLFLVLHFSVQEEISQDVGLALAKLADNGFVMLSQTVLLKGVNDDVKILSELFKKLTVNRVIPYYLYHNDYVKGAEHFRTTVNKGLEIIDEMIGKVSGYLVPKYIVDTKNGKMLLMPNPIKKIGEKEITFTDYQGVDFKHTADFY